MAAMIKFLMTNELLLLSGNDIPFVEGSITIHAPTIGEIAYIGEETFFSGCQLLTFSKDILTAEDNLRLSEYDDFNILMSIMNDKSESLSQSVSCAQAVLSLLFPCYEIAYLHNAIVFTQNNEVAGMINTTNFNAFKNILKAVFCLARTDVVEYQAEGELAKKIAEKFKKRKQKLAELKQTPNKVAILSRYISILAVGEQKDINSFMNYTVYQLFDEFQRFELKTAYDIFFKARLAGAKDLKTPEDWMKDIHDKGN